MDGVIHSIRMNAPLRPADHRCPMNPLNRETSR